MSHHETTSTLSATQVYPIPSECEVVVNSSVPLSDGSQLTELELYRVLPARRWVMSAHWRGQPVFAKIFIGPQADKYASRDAHGAQAMYEAGLLTPELLWQGPDTTGRAKVLIYAAIPQAENISQLYMQYGDSQRLELIQKVVQVLAQQHAAGLVQTDLHLKNFMLSDGMAWALDGDGIRQSMLSRRAAYQQLAQLIGKLSVLDQHAWAKILLQAYQQKRSWNDAPDVGQILNWARRYKAREVREYVERKIFRNCTDVAWQQTSSFVLAQTKAVALPILSPEILDAAMQAGSKLKSGNTSTVVRALIAQQEVVSKRYNIKNIWHALGRSWRASRAAVSWSNAHRLQYHGFHTPQPLAMLENRRFGLRGEAYFISALSVFPDAFVFFKTVKDEVLRQEAIKQLVLMCYQFYLLKISHGDLKATNFQINPQGQAIIMDLDSMQQHCINNRAMRAHVKDIRRLLQNWKDDTSLYNALLESFNAVYVDKTPLKLAGISI